MVLSFELNKIDRKYEELTESVPQIGSILLEYFSLTRVSSKICESEEI